MELVASHIMKAAVVMVSPDLTLSELDQKFIEERVGGFPVVEEGRLIGLVTRSDIIREIDIETVVAKNVSDFFMDEDGFHEVPLTDFSQVATRVGEQLNRLTVRDAMCKEIISVGPNDPVRRAAELMAQHRVHRVLVTDDHQLLGMISSLDIARLLADGRLVPAGG